MERHACSGTLSDTVAVKDEPLWDSGTGACSVSEAAALAGLYTDHEVKDELVVGPEVLQPPDAVFKPEETCANSEPSRGASYHCDHTYAKTGCLPTEVCDSEEVQFVKELAGPLKVGPEWARSAASAAAALHIAHEVKVELVTEPECRQPPDVVFALRAAPQQASAVRGGAEQLARTDCEQRERGKHHETPRPTDTRHGTPDHESNVSSHAEIDPDVEKSTIVHPKDTNSAEKETNECPICSERFTLKSLLLDHVMIHIHMPTSAEGEESSRRVADDVLVSRAHTRARGQQPPAPRTHTTRAHTTRTHNTRTHITPAHTTRKRTTRALTTAGSASLSPKAFYTRKETLSCEMCDKKFTRMSRLEIHIRMHTNERPYSCDICKKAFADAGTLKKHTRIHSGEKPHSCKICNKQFLLLFNLRTHERVHTGERPYSCEVCQKKFTQWNSLSTHKRIHTGEKPHSCGVCKTKFRDLGHLKRHERIHTGERPYSCKICDKKFMESGTLKKHTLTHSGEKPFACDLCTKRYTRKYILATHIQTYHAKKKK